MKLLGKTVLVTGAAGLLGGALAKRLAADGAVVRALARHPERERFLRDVDGITLVQGDITDKHRMHDVTQGCDIVFHAAAIADGALGIQREINVEGTRNVMQAAAEAHAQRIVHVSTLAVYGFRERGDISEDMSLEPEHAAYAAYGITKAEAEAVVRSIAHKHELDYSILRPGMIYGPRSINWTAGMFKMAKRKPTIFIGSGSGWIHPMHVDDVVDLMTVLAVHSAAAGQTFNCAPDPAPTWREFLGAYAALAGHDRWLQLPVTPIKVIARLVAAVAPRSSQLKDMPYVINLMTGYRRYSMDKVRTLLTWQPKISLSEGIESCVPYLREEGLLN